MTSSLTAGHGHKNNSTCSMYLRPCPGSTHLSPVLCPGSLTRPRCLDPVLLAAFQWGSPSEQEAHCQAGRVGTGRCSASSPSPPSVLWAAFPGCGCVPLHRALFPCAPAQWFPGSTIWPPSPAADPSAPQGASCCGQGAYLLRMPVSL